LSNELFSLDNHVVTEMVVSDQGTVYRYNYLYNINGDKVLETTHIQSGSTWNRYKQTEWLYFNTFLTKQVESEWDNTNSKWVTTYTIDYIYDNNLVQTELHNTYSNTVITPSLKTVFVYVDGKKTNESKYNYQISNWVLVEDVYYQYSANGNLENSTTSVFSANVLQTQYFSTFLYNENNTLSSELIQQKNPSDLTWQNLKQINWYYQPSSTLVAVQRSKNWLASASIWENESKHEYLYNAQNVLYAEICQAWKLNFWEDVTRYDYQHDNAGNTTKSTLSIPKYNKWRVFSYVDYSNFEAEKANLIESKFDFWGGETGSYYSTYIPFAFNTDFSIKKGNKMEIKREVYTADITVYEQNKNNILQVYPNPSEGVFYVDINKTGVKSWEVYDLYGHVLKASNNKVITGTIDLTDFQDGIYIISLKTDTLNLVQRVIKK